jgi:hypothetical protein
MKGPYNWFSKKIWDESFDDWNRRVEPNLIRGEKHMAILMLAGAAAVAGICAAPAIESQAKVDGVSLVRRSEVVAEQLPNEIPAALAGWMVVEMAAAGIALQKRQTETQATK